MPSSSFNTMPSSAFSSSPAYVCVLSQSLSSIPHVVCKMTDMSYDRLTGNISHQDRRAVNILRLDYWMNYNWMQSCTATRTCVVLNNTTGVMPPSGLTKRVLNNTTMATRPRVSQRVFGTIQRGRHVCRVSYHVRCDVSKHDE